MIIRTLYCLLIIFLAQIIQGQNLEKSTYHKLKINITGRNIQDLTNAGLETDHGIYVKNRFFTSDFSEEEIEVIKKLGFEYEFLINNVSKYYSDPSRSSEISSPQLQLRNNCFAPSMRVMP